MRRKALQEIVDGLCRAAASDKRCAAEIRGAHPDGGRLTLDLLGATCALNGAPLEAIGLTARLQRWLYAHLQTAEIPPARIRRARVDIEYTVAERMYLERGHVWEMHFSLRAEIATDGRVYEGALPQCMSSVAYGAGAAW
jgi:hypothetical protein